MRKLIALSLTLILLPLVKGVSDPLFVISGYTVNASGIPVNGTVKGTIYGTDQSFLANITDGIWELNFSMEDKEFEVGIFLNDTKGQIGYAVVRKLGGETVSFVATCERQKVRVKGKILYPARRFSGELRIRVGDEVNTTSFTLGEFNFTFAPCLIAGEVNEVEVRATVGRRFVGYYIRRLVP